MWFLTTKVHASYTFWNKFSSCKQYWSAHTRSFIFLPSLDRCCYYEVPFLFLYRKYHELNKYYNEFCDLKRYEFIVILSYIVVGYIYFIVHVIAVLKGLWEKIQCPHFYCTRYNFVSWMAQELLGCKKRQLFCCVNCFICARLHTHLYAAFMSA